MMNRYKGRNRGLRHGAVLIIAVIFVALFSSLALAMLTMSSTNIQIADNHRQGNRALLSAESGLEVMRYWLDDTAVSAKDLISVNNALAPNLSINPDSPTAPTTLTVDAMDLDSQSNQTFSAAIRQIDTQTLQLSVMGNANSISRTIRANYTYGVRENSVFDYGVATRGPLSLSGNIDMSGATVAIEADVYIESNNQNEALSIIGNSQIAGNATITNPDAYVTLQGGQAGIGGETGDDALEHVTTGAEPAEFPVPLTSHFEQYVQNVFDPEEDDTSADNTFENIRIPGGTNPTFSGNVTLNGIIFIETPNIVTFTGNVDITGIIIGDGDMNDDSGANQLAFLGNVSSNPVTDLPETILRQRQQQPCHGPARDNSV